MVREGCRDEGFNALGISISLCNIAGGSASFSATAVECHLLGGLWLRESKFLQELVRRQMESVAKLGKREVDGRGNHPLDDFILLTNINQECILIVHEYKSQKHKSKVKILASLGFRAFGLSSSYDIFFASQSRLISSAHRLAAVNASCSSVLTGGGSCAGGWVELNRI